MDYTEGVSNTLISLWTRPKRECRREGGRRGNCPNNGFQRDTHTHMLQRKNKNRVGWVLKQSRSVESQILPLSVLFTGHFHPRDIPERLTLLEMTTIMCELKRRASHSMNPTCKNKHKVPQGEELSHGSRAAPVSLICLWSQTERHNPSLRLL